MALRSVRRFIAFSKITSGMIIEFGYTKADGTNGKYTVLVIDPNKVSEGSKNPLLHGFVVSDLTDTELLRFVSNFELVNAESTDKRRALVEELNSDNAYETFSVSEYKSQRLYRTFLVDKINRPRQVLLGSA